MLKFLWEQKIITRRDIGRWAWGLMVLIMIYREAGFFTSSAIFLLQLHNELVRWTVAVNKKTEALRAEGEYLKSKQKNWN